MELSPEYRAMAFVSSLQCLHLGGRDGIPVRPTRSCATRMSSKGFARPRKIFKYTGKVRPGTVSPKRSVPSDIMRPSYADDGIPKEKQPQKPWEIEIKSDEDIEAMRISGRLAREVLDLAGRTAVAGASTEDIDVVVHEETLKRGAYPSPLNYGGFPKACCTSVNEIIGHGIPDSTILNGGDIINVDVTVYHNGFHGDCSETFLVGDVDPEASRLVRVTYECLQRAIAVCKPGIPYSEIGNTIQRHADANNVGVFKDGVGHGIGQAFHTTPDVLHFANNVNNGIMRKGHVFTIEPMINEGSARGVMWPDGWTSATKDGRRSAQFEHTVLSKGNLFQV